MRELTLQINPFDALSDLAIGRQTLSLARGLKKDSQPCQA